MGAIGADYTLLVKCHIIQLWMDITLILMVHRLNNIIRIKKDLDLFGKLVLYMVYLSKIY